MRHEAIGYFVKPMNCPVPRLVLQVADEFSAATLPIRLSELGASTGYERLGVVHGLLRAAVSPRTTRTSSVGEDQLVDESWPCST